MASTNTDGYKGRKYLNGHQKQSLAMSGVAENERSIKVLLKNYMSLHP